MSDQPTPSLYGEAPAPEAKPTPPGLLDQVVGVFTEPVALFKRLRQSPVWAPALILAIVVGVAATLVWAARVDMVEVTRHQMETMRDVFRMNIPEEAIDKALSQAEGKRPWVSSVLGPLFGTPIVFALFALILWAFAAMGTQDGEEPPTWGQVFSVSCVHYLSTLPGMLLAGVVAAFAPIGARQIQGLVPTSLGFFLHPESLFLKGLVGLADPLWIYSFVVLAIGMREGLRTKTWAIAAALAFFALFGGGFRFLGGLMS